MEFSPGFYADRREFERIAEEHWGIPDIEL